MDICQLVWLTKNTSYENVGGIFLRRNIKLVWKFNWTPYIIPILTIFGTMVAVTIYVSSDITMLGFLKNNYIVGIYSISAKIYGMVGPMLSATMAVTIPRLAMLMGQGKMSNYKQLFKKLLQTMILIVLPAVVGLMMTSKSIVLIITGGEYLRSATPLSILSIALFFGTLNTIFVECVLIPAKRERATLITAVIAAITNLLLNFVLIPHYSEVGTAMTTVIAECLSMLMNFYFSGDIIGEIFLAKGFWKENLNIVIGTIAIWLVCILIKSLIYSNIIQLIISIICSCVIYINLIRFKE